MLKHFLLPFLLVFFLKRLFLPTFWLPVAVKVGFELGYVGTLFFFHQILGLLFDRGSILERGMFFVVEKFGVLNLVEDGGKILPDHIFKFFLQD